MGHNVMTVGAYEKKLEEEFFPAEINWLHRRIVGRDKEGRVA